MHKNQFYIIMIIIHDAVQKINTFLKNWYIGYTCHIFFGENHKYLLIHFHLKNAADCAGLPPQMAREFKN